MDGHFVPNITIGLVVTSLRARYRSSTGRSPDDREEPRTGTSRLVQAGANTLQFTRKRWCIWTALESDLLARREAAWPLIPQQFEVEMLTPVLDIGFVLVMTANPGSGAPYTV